MAATTLSMASSIFSSSAVVANVALIIIVRQNFVGTREDDGLFRVFAFLHGEKFIKDRGRLQTTSSSARASFRRHQCLTPEFHRVEIAQAWPRRRAGSARAAQEDDSSTQESPTSTPPPPGPVSEKKTAAKKEIEKGQITAIVTGVISVLLGVGYLVLVQLLDTRGVNLIPPPPEAFDP